MTIYFCNIIRPNGTSTIKEIDAWDREAAAREALSDEPQGSHTTARPINDPTGAVREDLDLFGSSFPLVVKSKEMT